MLGAGRDASEMVYVMLSSGIGGGLVVGGRLYRGARGTAGEIGHVIGRRAGSGLPLRQPRLPRDLAGAGAVLELLRRIAR